MKYILDFLQSFLGYFLIYQAVYSFRGYDSQIKTFSKRFWIVMFWVLIGGIILTL